MNLSEASYNFDGTNAGQQKNGKTKMPKSGKGSKSSAETAPIFLRKTYHMIDTCDPTVATWSEDGTAFVVKDTEKFASEIIGQFFKHNNFSSFVRQLNFYGFRKIKSDPLRIRDASKDIECKYWKFRHEKFQRGRPDLLAEIRKSNHTEAADKQEVEALKKEVNELQTRMGIMHQEMEKMATLVATVMQQQAQPAPYDPLQPDSAKKRKLNSLENDFINDPTMPLPVGSEPLRKVTSLEKDLLGANTFAPISLDFPSRNSRGNLTGTLGNPSISSFTSTDEHILSSLFALESSDDVSVIRKAMPSSKQNFQFPEPRKEATTANSGDPDEALMKKLRSSIALLPRNLQEMFVDRIVAFMTNPESFKKQVDAISALASAAAAEAAKHVGGNVVDTPQSNALASAILGAWLAKYGGADQSMQRSAPPPAPVQPQQTQIASVLNVAPL